ncbi:MAG: hypothetical protein AB9917_20650 [Negativicutes bacterium]
MPTIKYKNNIVELSRSDWAAFLIAASFLQIFQLSLRLHDSKIANINKVNNGMCSKMKKQLQQFEEQEKYSLI